MSATATSTEASEPPEPRRLGSSSRRFGIVFFGAAVLVAVLFAMFGRVSFNPTDDGTLLSHSYRLLNGQVPHRDVIFARPLGSAVLHMIDFALPMPLFEASRLVGISTIVLYSFLLAWLIYRAPPREWGMAKFLGAVAASLINIHAFFLTSWYTTDGLLFTAAGLVMLECGLKDGKRSLVWGGMTALGVAPVMKQSFALVPLIGVVWVWWQGRRSNEAVATRFAVIAAAFGAIPIILYVAVIGALGGLDEFFYQISTARPVWGANSSTSPTRRAVPRGHGRSSSRRLRSASSWVDRFAPASRSTTGIDSSRSRSASFSPA